MTYTLDPKTPKGLPKGEALRTSLRFVLVFFGSLVLIDVVWTFLIRGVAFYFSVFFFSSFIGSIVRVILALPFLIILAVGAFSGLSKFLQIISSLLVAWIIAYAFDFFWSNMIQVQLWGLDIVVDGELTHVGFLVGLIIASRDVFFAVCLAYLILWSEKK